MSEENTSLNEAEVATEETNVEEVETEVKEAPESDAGDEKDKVEDNGAEDVSPEEKIRQEVEQKLKKATQKRFDRMTYELRQKEEALQKAVEEANKYKPKEELPPSEDDFETFEEWQDAVVEFKAEQRIKQKEQEFKQEQLQKAQLEKVEQGRKRFEAMEQEYRQENPSYDEENKLFFELSQDAVRLKGAQNPTLTAMGQVLSEVEGAPALISHLAKNEDEFYDLIEQSPVSAAFKLFELKQELSKAPRREAKKLPEPTKPVKANGKASKTVSEMSGRELLEKFAK